MEQVKCYPVDLVFTILEKENVETDIYNKGCKSPMNQIKVDGYDVYTRSLRYMTFYQKGCTCVACGKVGTHFTLDASNDGNPNRRHFNLRADDGTLMTRDHIIPKSRGGREHISNMQTMCVDCNKAKGNRMDTDEIPEIKIVAIKTDNTTKTRGYVNEDDAIFCICNDIIKVTQSPTKKQKMDHKIKKTIEIVKTFFRFLLCNNSLRRNIYA